jgi:hypothetical protein
MSGPLDNRRTCRVGGKPWFAHRTNSAGWTPVSNEGRVFTVLAGVALTAALIGYYWHLVAKSWAIVTVVVTAVVCHGLILCKGAR